MEPLSKVKQVAEVNLANTHSSAGLQQAHAQLVYAQQCCEGELDPATCCLINEVCQGFLDTYEERARLLQFQIARQQATAPLENRRQEEPSMQQRQASQASDDSHFILRKEGSGPGLVPTAPECANLELSPDQGCRQLHRPPFEGLPRETGSGGSGDFVMEGSEDDQDDGIVGSTTAAADSLEILQLCQRHVTGSLDEVSGLE